MDVLPEALVLSRRPHRCPAFRSAALALATAALLLPAGCSRAPLLARGPFDLTTTPVNVPFAQPVAAAGPTWELTFEFDRPGDSHAADCLHVALVDESGRRHRLADPRLDRRGESMICLVGALEDGGAGASSSFVAMELSSDAPVRVESVRGLTR